MVNMWSGYGAALSSSAAGETTRHKFSCGSGGSTPLALKYIFTINPARFTPESARPCPLQVLLRWTPIKDGGHA